jgi:hypothetical protein
VYGSSLYGDLTETCLVADPQELLRTRPDAGFVGHVNSLLYLPPPSLINPPISCPDEATNTWSVAVEIELVAETRRSCHFRE